MDDNVEILRRYNRWRRGQALWSAEADLPDPRVVGEAIDAACDEIERLRAEISTAEAFHKVAVAERNYERQRADILESAAIKALEDRDRLRAELAESKRLLRRIDGLCSNELAGFAGVKAAIRAALAAEGE